MAHPLDGPRHKLGRAEAQLDRLEAEIARFLRRDSYEVAQDFDPKTGGCVLHFVIKHQPPLRWSVLIGEIVHNLRSALDHLACQLFLLNRSGECESTSFPILIDDSEEGFGKWIEAHLPGLPADAITKLREFQPYHRGNKARIHPLAHLNRLSNRDKHRLLVPVFAALTPGGTGMIGFREQRDVEMGGETEFFLDAGPPLQHGAELARLHFTITGPDPYVEVEPHFPVDIAFADGGPVVTILRLIGGSISTKVFPSFLPFFPPIKPVDPEVLPPPRPIR